MVGVTLLFGISFCLLLLIIGMGESSVLNESMTTSLTDPNIYHAYSTINKTVSKNSPATILAISSSHTFQSSSAPNGSQTHTNSTTAPLQSTSFSMTTPSLSTKTVLPSPSLFSLSVDYTSSMTSMEVELSSQNSSRSLSMKVTPSVAMPGVSPGPSSSSSSLSVHTPVISTLVMESSSPNSSSPLPMEYTPSVSMSIEFRSPSFTSSSSFYMPSSTAEVKKEITISSSSQPSGLSSSNASSSAAPIKLSLSTSSSSSLSKLLSVDGSSLSVPVIMGSFSTYPQSSDTSSPGLSKPSTLISATSSSFTPVQSTGLTPISSLLSLAPSNISALSIPVTSSPSPPSFSFSMPQSPTQTPLLPLSMPGVSSKLIIVSLLTSSAIAVTTTTSIEISINVDDSLKIFEVTAVIDREWDKNFALPVTKEFRMFKEEIEESLKEVFKDSPGFLYIQVIAFRKGSVKCDFKVYFRQNSDIDDNTLISRIENSKSETLKGVKVDKVERVGAEKVKKENKKSLELWMIIAIAAGTVVIVYTVILIVLLIKIKRLRRHVSISKSMSSTHIGDNDATFFNMQLLRSQYPNMESSGLFNWKDEQNETHELQTFSASGDDDSKELVLDKQGEKSPTTKNDDKGSAKRSSETDKNENEQEDKDKEKAKPVASVVEMEVVEDHECVSPFY